MRLVSNSFVVSTASPAQKKNAASQKRQFRSTASPAQKKKAASQKREQRQRASVAQKAVHALQEQQRRQRAVLLRFRRQSMSCKNNNATKSCLSQKQLMKRQQQRASAAQKAVHDFNKWLPSVTYIRLVDGSTNRIYVMTDGKHFDLVGTQSFAGQGPVYTF